MYKEVGVPSYGRGEVGIAMQSEPIVREVLVRILGLFHRPQQDGIDQSFLGLSPYLLQQALELPRAMGSPHF